MKREELLKMIGNREIKFRVWDNISKTMDYNPNLLLINDVHLNDQIDELRQNNYILMQYTGLEDRDGKEIWEGDVVSFKVWNFKKDRTKILKDVVVFDGGMFKTQKHKMPISSMLVPKVIGNIFENPELLEDE